MSSRPSPLRLGLMTARGRAYPRLIGLNREPSWMFFDIALPLLAVIALLLVYRALGADARFEGYVIIGGAMTSFWLSTLWMMAMQFRWDKEAGNLELFLVAPTHVMWILVGMAVGGATSTTVRATTVVALGAWGFGVPFEWGNLGWAFLVIGATIAALYSVGGAVASLFLKFGRGIEKAIETLQEPVYLITGSFFPVRALGIPVAVLGSIVPLTLGMDALRQLLLAGEADQLLPWWAETLILIPYAIGTMALARLALDRMERSAKEDGRLTVKWQ